MRILPKGWGEGEKHQVETGGTVWELMQSLEQCSFPIARVKKSLKRPGLGKLIHKGTLNSVPN